MIWGSVTAQYIGAYAILKAVGGGGSGADIGVFGIKNSYFLPLGEVDSYFNHALAQLHAHYP